jgi:hypothetical protein
MLNKRARKQLLGWLLLAAAVATILTLPPESLTARCL